MTDPAKDLSQSSFSPPPTESLWRSIWRNKRSLWNWDLVLALVLAVVAVIFVRDSTLATDLKTVLVAELGLIGALLGIVIAGLAIVIGFLSSEYAVVMMKSEGGPAAEFWPFWFVALLTAISILAAGSGVFVIAQEPCLSRVVLGLTTFFSCYAVLAAVNLVAFVKAQGETRAFLLAREWERTQRGRRQG